MSLLQSIDYHAVGPLLVLGAGTLACLLAGRRTALPIALVATGTALVWTLTLIGHTRKTFCLAPTTLPAVVGGGRVGRSCSYVVDDRALLIQVLVLASLLVVLLIGRHPGAPAGEWHLLLLASATGMVAIAAARDLLLLIVALEVLSLPGYALAGLRRRDRRSSEAALKFFLISVVASAVSLLGMALLYGLTGSLQLDRISGQLTHADIRGPATAAAVMLTLTGFLFKVSAVPFHTWAPDTYQGAPLPVAAWLAVASKVAGFAGLITLLADAFGPYADVWGPALAGLAAATMTLGSLVALQQNDVLRLLAWSSISQAGYVLVPLAATTDRARARGASLGYLAIYAIASLAVFAAVALLIRPDGAPSTGTSSTGTASTGTLAALHGSARRHPVVAGVLVFGLLNLGGLPPGLAGLFAKVVVVRAAVDGGLGWLAVLVAVNTVLGLAVYLRLVTAVFTAAKTPDPTIDPARDPAPAQAQVQRRRPAVSRVLAAALPAVAVAAIGVAPSLVLHATTLAGR